MEESSRRPTTPRGSTSGDSAQKGEPKITLRSRLETSTLEAVSITPDQLFALFAAVAGDLHLSTVTSDDTMYEQLANNDIGVFDAGTTLIGEGGQFSVRASNQSYPGPRFVLKSVRIRDFSKREEQARLGGVILELRALSHRPLRHHRNIVKLLGLGWETDSKNVLQKWPVLIQEYAHGTLDDLLKREPGLPYGHRLELSLGVSNGLDAIHRCSIVHGDLKPANVLVFVVSQRSESRCPWVPKLADFGGSVLDVAEKGLGRLPFRSKPWQAPEWADYLTREGLLATDVYSLGLTIWSIMAKGALPTLDVADVLAEAEEATPATDKNHFLEAFSKLGTSMFAVDVNKAQVETVLAAALQPDPSKRSLARVCQLLRDLLKAYDEAFISEQSDTNLTYSPVTQLSHVENLLMLPDMLDTFTPSVQDYIRERLIGVFEMSNTTVKSAAAFTLAVDAIRHTESPDSAAQCMTWLIRSAQSGNQTAQSLVYRFANALDYKLPLEIQAKLEAWMIDAAQRNHPAAQEDLPALVSDETLQSVWTRFRTRYAGIGWNRFASMYEDQKASMSELDAGLRDKLALAMARPDFRAQSLGVGNNGDSILHFAASAGLEQVVELWSNRSAMLTSVDSVGAQSETPLLISCRSGHGNVVRSLLRMGADPRIQDINGDTPLHWLVSFRAEEAVDIASKLVAAGAHVDAEAHSIQFEFAPLCSYAGGTPLHRAVGRGNLDAVQALLEHDASAISAGGREDGMSPIAMAASLHYADILDVLLGSVGDPLAATHPHTGLSLLAHAIRGELVYGEKFSKIARHGRLWWDAARQTFDVIRKWGGESHMHSFPAGMDCAGTAPLLQASAYNLPEVVEYLIENGCRDDVNTRSYYWMDGGCYTPIVKSIFHNCKGVFSLLLRYHADASQIHVDEDYHDLPPLYICAAAGHSDAYFAQEFFARGALIDGFKDVKSELFETPFGCALRRRCFGLAKWLLEHGADPHIEYNKGFMSELTYPCTVLGFLVKERTMSSLACIGWLLREVPDMGFIISSQEKYSVLHAVAMYQPNLAADDKNSAVPLLINVLLNHFKPTVEQVNQHDSNGRTAIWIAVAMGQQHLVKRLLEIGADPRIANDEGFDAVDVNDSMLEKIGDDDASSPMPADKQIEQKRHLREAIGKLLG